MTITFTDQDIASLIAERKSLPSDWRTRMKLRPKRGHEERDFDCKGEMGGTYRVILRQSNFNVLDFSAILAVQVPQSNRLFRLRRYNGKSHEHTNGIERVTFYDYHIHMATERYQVIGAHEDAYAEITDRYSDLDGALRCLFDDATFDDPIDAQMKLL